MHSLWLWETCVGEAERTESPVYDSNLHFECVSFLCYGNKIPYLFKGVGIFSYIFGSSESGYSKMGFLVAKVAGSMLCCNCSQMDWSYC